MRWIVVLALAAAGCESGDAAASRARELVARFEQALRQGDRALLRALVTSESRPAVDALPLEAVAAKQPLAILGASARDGAMRVRVRDPNRGGADGAFVVVAENGELRVDLVASAGLTAREVPQPGPSTRTVIRPLSPAERAHAARLAQQMDTAPPR
jgi:hypothetical protein